MIDPVLIVAAGVALCVVPVLFGLIVARWPRPTLRHDKRVTEMVYDGQLYRRDAADAMIRGGPAMVPDEAWQREGMQDEGDLLATAHCPCPRCVDKRTEAARNAAARA